tara:strand:+ start:1471 stop:2379 length:909 start_codon:yes stop_codon:yes gene_type:complete
MKIKFLALLVLLFFTKIAHCYDSKSYNAIIENLRCLVCQNQSLAESDSSLAKDLRVKVKNMLDDGKSEDDIYKFMSDRYTDYVLYNPPVKKSTWFLWYAPFIILFLSLLYLFWKFKYESKKIYQNKNLSNKKESARLLSNSNIINTKTIYIFLLIFVPILSLSIYSYSSEYIRYKISYYFADKNPIIDVTVSVDNDILAKITGNEILFVYARNSKGRRIPLAIDIFDVIKDKKNYNIKLDNTMNMDKNHTLSSASEVIVEARITLHKKATTTPGDFIGTSKSLKLNDSNYLLLNINTVVIEE